MFYQPVLEIALSSLVLWVYLFRYQPMVKLDANCLGGKIGKTKVIFQGPNVHFHAFIYGRKSIVYQWIFAWEKQGDVFIYSTVFLDLENLRVRKYVASWQVVYNQNFVESDVSYRIMGSQNWWGDTRGLLLYRYKIKWITLPYNKWYVSNLDLASKFERGKFLV